MMLPSQCFLTLPDVSRKPPATTAPDIWSLPWGLYLRLSHKKPFFSSVTFCGCFEDSNEKSSWYKDQIIRVKHLVLCASRRWGSECQTSGGSQDPETWISWDFLGDLLGIWLFLTFARWNVQSCLLITPGWLGLCHCFISTWRVPSVNFSSHWKQ